MPLPFTRVGDQTFKYATFCEALSAELGPDLYIAKSEFGKGLFANRAFAVGSVLCAYDGALITTSQANDGRAQTHMLRLKDTDLVVDGLPLSRRLRFDRVAQRFFPEFVEDWDQGWACIANSSAGGVSNAKLVQVRDDRHNREEGYDPLTQANLPPSITNQMLPRAFLVASRPIEKHDEILWYYNPTFQAVQVIELEGGNTQSSCPGGSIETRGSTRP